MLQLLAAKCEQDAQPCQIYTPSCDSRRSEALRDQRMLRLLIFQLQPRWLAAPPHAV